MTNKIALTASMRSNLLSLQNTQKLFNSTQDHLSTGYKVNSAMDNPSSYFTAQALNSRANDLSTLLDSIGQSISTLEVADQGITTLQSYVEQAKSVANSARDTSNVASKATTNNVKFDPDNARTDLVSDYVDLTAGPAPREAVGTKNVNLDDKLFGDLNAEPGNVTFTVNDEATDIAFDASDTVASFIEKVNTTLDGKVKAEYVDGSVKFSTVDNATLEIASNRKTETHKGFVMDFSGNTVDLSSLADNDKAVLLGDGTSELSLADGSDIASMAFTSRSEKVAAVNAIADQLRASATNLGNAGSGVEITVDENALKITIKDNKEGNTTALAAGTNITHFQNVAQSDTGNYAVGLVGKSFNEAIGLGSAPAAQVKVSKEGTANPGNSFSVRLGDATKMTGTANLRPDKTLEEMGMIDGQSIDIIVGEDTHTYTIGKEIDKTSTMQDFMDDIVYDIGRTKIKAEIVDGSLTISTLDNSSLSIRSTNQVETRDATKIAKSDFGVANRTLTNVQITPDGAAAPTTVDLTGIETAEGVADAINANSDLKAAGIMAKVDVNGNVAIFDKNGDNAAPAITFNYSNNGTPASNNGTAGKTDYELKGTSFNELVGFAPAQTVEVSDDMTVEKFRQAINNLDGISADFDTKGHLVISGEQGDDLVMVNDKNSNVLRNLFGDDVVSATNGSNERAKYAQQFDDIMTQIDELVQDTSYKGINLLNGDSLLVNFNESRTSSLNIKGVTFDSVGLGFTRSANEWISNDDIDSALNQISKATSLLRAQASEFGQNLSTVQIREDFTQNMINNLQSGADKLTLADMNEEAANMLALQTRQQLATNSLSMANQSAQSVLRLF